MRQQNLGVVVVERGAAIVTVERSEDDGLLVTGIERLPFSLAAVADRIRALDDSEARMVIDGEGLGSALWGVLARTIPTIGCTMRAVASNGRRSWTSCSWRSRRIASASHPPSPSRKP